jgi:hypothetical protein
MDCNTWIKVMLGFRIPGVNLSRAVVRKRRGWVLRRGVGNSCKTLLSAYIINDDFGNFAKPKVVFHTTI